MDRTYGNIIDLYHVKNSLESYRPATQSSDNLQILVTNAAVIAFIYYKKKDLCVLLNKRSQLVEHHKGEISFPGGVMDYEDKSILDTALREAAEEMGIQPAHVDIVSQLSSVITRTNFIITPFVGIIPEAYPFNVNKEEIDQILEIPLTSLINQLEQQISSISPQIPENSFHYSYENHIIWGATANILSELLLVLSKTKLQEDVEI
tara:strand:+ start:9417 stop:10034 length:618 start_codon:yes stop_codon:yes gene_type:complete